ncbi:hypothetical protein N7492_007178 [Penicillium capsulatum]|uniref:Uncharacterized protein n=1 Tax=Penicillium capsulatum TaxID=69766 RepID=A0A9W9I1J0_9EURO|nr:hypothetical protein N7492_007178 [Penicillium capsulatum]KAJ6117016.1 hypothetical protein N7512_006741 [Penicillium capsulatum]
MCGETNRPTFGGTIAVLFPREPRFSSSASDSSLSSSPDSVASSSSFSGLSSYSLFFRDADAESRKTKAVFRIDDAETYQTLRGCRDLNMRIEKFGDLSSTAPSTPPLHQFRLDLSHTHRQQPGQSSTDLELELPERLDLGASEKGVVGRQVTVTEAGGAVLGVGIVGYN